MFFRLGNTDKIAMIQATSPIWRGVGCMVFVTCVRCGNKALRFPYQVKSGKTFFCSPECHAQHRRKRSLSTSGYWILRMPNHPMATKDGRILEHRLIMAEHLGRMLEPNEIVHHKDHNRQNNAIENLELVDGHKSHAEEHRKETERYKLFQEGKLYCSSCREAKPIEAFSRSKVGPMGRNNQCKDCHSDYYRKTHPDRHSISESLTERHWREWLASEQYQLFQEGKHRCTKCGEVKPLKAFAPNRQKTAGVSSHCRNCQRRYRDAWRAKRKAQGLPAP